MPDRKRTGCRAWVWRGLVSMLLGAMLNLAVAWGFAWLNAQRPSIAPFGSVHSFVDPEPQFGWTVAQEHALGTTRVRRSESSHLIPAVSIFFAPAPAWSMANDPPPPYHISRSNQGRYYVEYAYGFPFRSMRSDVVMAANVRIFIVSSGVLIGPEQSAMMVLPLGVIVPGSLGNTAFYGAIVFLLLCIRPLKRRLRGGCTRCGYDLRGSDSACPECGAPGRHHAAAAQVED